ncbi:MAG: biopolymer transporter ExbD [Candidatus Poribacteria bacterium]|nr:biopolymer transporter ExbD [Candidatus Poribacteria bacterium]
MKHLKRHKPPTLSMAPMIDCVFLLLIFFMVSTTFAPIPGLRVQLPPPVDRPITHDRGIVVTIADPAPGETEGTIIIRQQSREEIVQTGEMFNWLINAPEDTKIMVIIQAGNEVFHEQIVQVMDILKQVGIDRIGFARAGNTSVRIID